MLALYHGLFPNKIIFLHDYLILVKTNEYTEYPSSYGSFTNAGRCWKTSVHSYLYDGIIYAKVHIAEACGNRNVVYTMYWRIIDEKWSSRLHSALHSAAYFLNPSIRYRAEVSNDAEIQRDLKRWSLHGKKMLISMLRLLMR